MFKFVAILVLAIACASAKPAPQFVTYDAPLFASAAYATAPIATSAVVSREYHGVPAPLIASPYSSPYIAAPAYAYSAPLFL